MGYIKLPSYEHYWSQSADIVSFVSSHMTKDRFKLILSSLHLNDNSVISQHKGERFYKVDPLINNIKKKFVIISS